MTDPESSPVEAAEPMAIYVAALQSQDWNFEFSDDGAAVRAGRESLAKLRAAQQQLDPDFVHWNLWAPEERRVHVVPGQKPSGHTMAVYRVVLQVVDHENLGQQSVIDQLENMKYLNGRVHTIAMRSIDWAEGAHPINFSDKAPAAFVELFGRGAA